MSISVPLAVTMMMGTEDWARMERQTSIPDKRGSIRSNRTRSGSSEAKRRRASLPSRATVTSNPSRVSPMTRASTKDSSSSARRTLVWLCSPGGASAALSAAAVPSAAPALGA